MLCLLEASLMIKKVKVKRKHFFSLLDSPEKYESTPRSYGKQIGHLCQHALCGHSNVI